MKTYIAKIKGISPYSQSKAVADPRGPKETHDDHEKRTWRDRLHANDKGNVIIPPMALKNCMAEAGEFSNRWTASVMDKIRSKIIPNIKAELAGA